MRPGPRTGRRKSRLWPLLVVMLIGSGILGLNPMALGEEIRPQPPSTGLEHGLEGMKFKGVLAAEGEENPPDDVLKFENGRFWSKTCLKFGFEPRAYWVRRDDEGLRFRATLRSPENGTARFEGVFDGNELRATVQWRKERWYWTLEKELRFTGRPVQRTE